MMFGGKVHHHQILVIELAIFSRILVAARGALNISRVSVASDDDVRRP